MDTLLTLVWDKLAARGMWHLGNLWHTHLLPQIVVPAISCCWLDWLLADILSFGGKADPDILDKKSSYHCLWCCAWKEVDIEILPVIMWFWRALIRIRYHPAGMVICIVLNAAPTFMFREDKRRHYNPSQLLQGIPLLCQIFTTPGDM